MNVNNLIILCRKFSAMGDAVCDQICDVVHAGEAVSDQNANAMKLALKFFKDAQRLGVTETDEFIRDIEDTLKAQDAT